MIVYEYITLTNGSTHMVRQSDFTAFKTLCGRDADGTMGDETISGVAATCKSCKRIVVANLPPPPSPPSIPGMTDVRRALDGE